MYNLILEWVVYMSYFCFFFNNRRAIYKFFIFFNFFLNIELFAYFDAK